MKTEFLKFKILKQKENGYNLIKDQEGRNYDLIELQIGKNHNKKICIDIKNNSLTVYSRNELIDFEDMMDYYPKYLVRVKNEKRKHNRRIRYDIRHSFINNGKYDY